ncbi:hypothetical protein JCM19235_6940 [Vibrio maritimus]|uniref:Uncharacterized protein n=1 Tax=Vibrio maritimus TaxID=990268 RepID=A0A090SFX0_9VIBR|nr:hypothetical protein JCM19235_6940 [Vibrio maritimus]
MNGITTQSKNILQCQRWIICLNQGREVRIENRKKSPS